MSPIVSLALATVLGWAVPAWLLRLMVPALREGRTVDNYRGRPVFLGLGVVWLVWAGGAILGGVAVSALLAAQQVSALPVLSIAGLLALVAFALGLVDDAFGSGRARGFRGHLAALASGRLTTGALKLFGISAAALACAIVLAQAAPWAGYEGRGATVLNASLALLAGAAIALTSNFINLTDLRPGRALKVSSVLMVAGVVSTGLLMVRSPAGAGPEFGQAAVWFRIADVIALAVFAFGPIAAVWRYDLSEAGMLGDAGANPMGAVAGLLVVAGLPLWGLVAYLALMLGLNLLSERTSFSAIIEGNALLRRFDGFGRLSDAGDDGRR